MVNALNILGIKLRAVSEVCTFKKKNYDKLTVEVLVDVTKKYINISKHKRILTYKKHLFSRENIRHVAVQLINKLAEINDLRRENGLKTNHDIEVFKTKLKFLE